MPSETFNYDILNQHTHFHHNTLPHLSLALTSLISVCHVSSLPAIASPTSSVQQPKMNRENSHRPIAEHPEARIDIHPRKQTVQLDRTARSIFFCWEREAETRNICHRRIDGCYTRRDINRDNKPDTNGTLKRDNSLSRQRKGTDHFRDSARQMLLPKRETEQSQQASTLWHQE